MCDICCLTCLIHVMERIHCCMKVTFYILWCFNIARKPSLPEDMKTVFFMWKLYFSNRNHCKKTWKPSTKIQFVGGKLIPQTVFLWTCFSFSFFRATCRTGYVAEIMATREKIIMAETSHCRIDKNVKFCAILCSTASFSTWHALFYSMLFLNDTSFSHLTFYILMFVLFIPVSTQRFI